MVAYVLSSGVLHLLNALVRVVGADVPLEPPVDPALNLVELGRVPGQVEGAYLVLVPIQEPPGLPAPMDCRVVHDQDQPLEPMPPNVPKEACQVFLELPAPPPSIDVVEDLLGGPEEGYEDVYPLVPAWGWDLPLLASGHPSRSYYWVELQPCLVLEGYRNPPFRRAEAAFL